MPTLTIAPADDDHAFARQADLDAERVTHLHQAGNRPYLARLEEEMVAHGWAAARVVMIGEIGVRVVLPTGERYPWGCATAPAHRGRGIYPHLLQTIVRLEGQTARYWIGHTPDNAASARGILKAGFRRVGDVYRLPTSSLLLCPTGSRERAEVGAALLGIALLITNTTTPSGA